MNGTRDKTAIQLIAEALMANPAMNTQFGFGEPSAPAGLVPIQEGLLGPAMQGHGLLDVLPQLREGYYGTRNGKSAEIIQPQFDFKPKINPLRGDYGFKATVKW